MNVAQALAWPFTNATTAPKPGDRRHAPTALPSRLSQCRVDGLRGGPPRRQVILHRVPHHRIGPPDDTHAGAGCRFPWSAPGNARLRGALFCGNCGRTA